MSGINFRKSQTNRSQSAQTESKNKLGSCSYVVIAGLLVDLHVTWPVKI